MTDGDRHAWVAPGPHAVATGVFRIPLSLPDAALQAVNVYALVDGDGLVLIDAGWQAERSTRELTAGLAELGLSYSDVRDVLVTHVHRDHYSEAMTIRRLAGARISLGAGERPNLEAVMSPDRVVDYGFYDYLRQLGAGPLVEELTQGGHTPTGYDGGWEAPDVWLQDARTIELADRELRVIATPGHTRGHVVYHDEANSLVFAGDHVLPHITPSIGLQPANTPLPLGDYLHSLDLMLQLPDCGLLPAHGAPSPSVHARVNELIDHHATRLALSANAVAARRGTATAFDVAQDLPWTGRERRYVELVPFHCMLAVAETAAHLEVLVSRGELAKDSSGECLAYSVPAPRGVDAASIRI